MKLWSSRVSLEPIPPRTIEWVSGGHMLRLRTQEEHDEARAWLILNGIPHREHEPLSFGLSIGYDVRPGIVIYRDEDLFWVKMRWL